LLKIPQVRIEKGKITEIRILSSKLCSPFPENPVQDYRSFQKLLPLRAEAVLGSGLRVWSWVLRVSSLVLRVLGYGTLLNGFFKHGDNKTV
jgi:hypothetical protein